MSVRWEGHQRAVCGIVHACAEKPSEELARIWSRPGDYGNPDPADTLNRDVGRNIQAMAHAIRGRDEDLDWLDRLHHLELERGLEGRDLMSPLYGGDNLLAALVTFWHLKEAGLDWQSAAHTLHRWIRARFTIAALMAAPHRVTQATWVQPDKGRDTGPGEHWRQGPSVLRAGSRVNRQVAVQEPVSDLLCAAIEYPGCWDERWADRAAQTGIHWDGPSRNKRLRYYPTAPGEVPVNWRPHYLDPCLALSWLANRLGLSLADTCGLTPGERVKLRGIVMGLDGDAADAAKHYLDGIPCHPGFGAIHFLRDEDSVATVIESNASRNKPTATVSVARWRETPDGMRCTMETHTPAPFRGTGAANVESELLINSLTGAWPPTSILGGEWSEDIPVPSGDVWYYRWTAEGWELVKGGGSSGVDRPGPVDGGGGDPRPSPPPKPPEPKPPKPEPEPSWWRRLLGWLRL